MSKKLGYLIANKREAMGLTKSKIYEDLRIAPATIKNYENGRHLKTFTKLIELIKELGISWDELDKVIQQS
jgi:transcriptional regulator with XRE-family HTH domain